MRKLPNIEKAAACFPHEYVGEADGVWHIYKTRHGARRVWCAYKPADGVTPPILAGTLREMSERLLLRTMTAALLIASLAAWHPARACEVWERCTPQQMIEDQQARIADLTWQNDRQREEISNLRAEETWDATPASNHPRDDE